MSYRDALLFEREGYVLRGLDDRVAQVDAELARIGAEPEPADEAPVDDEPEPEASDEAPVDDEAEAEPVEETADAGPTETTSRRKR